MALVCSASEKNYIEAYLSESPDAIPDMPNTSDSWTIAVCYYHPASGPSSDAVFLDIRDLSGSNNDQARFYMGLDTNNRLIVGSSHDDGTSDEKAESASLNDTGWRWVFSRRESAGSIGSYYDGGSEGVGNLTATEAPDVACDTIRIGRAINAAASDVDIKVACVIMFDDYLTPSQMNSIAASTTKAITLSGTTKRCDLRFNGSVDSELGTVKYASMMEATFEDDTDHFTSDSWTANEISQVASSNSCDIIDSTANQDYVVLGDSFGYGYERDTTPMHLLNKFADTASADFRKLLQGSSDANAGGANMLRAVEDEGTVNTFVRTADDGYTVDNGTDNIAIPIESMVEYEAGSSGTGDTYTTFKFRNRGSSITGPMAEWIDASTTINANLILYAVTNSQLGTVRLSDHSSNAADRTGLGSLATGEFHALDAYALSDNTDSNERWLNVRNASGSFPQAGRLCIGGVRGIKDGVSSGLGVMALAESSWAYSSYGNDTSSNGTSKTFTVEQIETLIAAYAETGREIVYLIHLDNETGTDKATFKTEMQAIVTLFEEVHTNQSLGTPKFLFVTPHMHTRGSSASLYDARVQAENCILAADELATENSNIACLHLYKLTDGAFFHSSTQSYPANDADGPQQAWLAAYDTANSTSYATTPGRNMLDGSDLHLETQADADFYGAIAAAELTANATAQGGAGRTQRTARTARTAR